MSSGPNFQTFYKDINSKKQQTDYIYKNTNNDDQKAKAIDDTERLLKNIEQILTLDMPQYYKQMFQGQQKECQANFEFYKKNFKRRVLAEGQGPKKNQN